jgi:CRISPR-associated protein Cas2
MLVLVTYDVKTESSAGRKRLSRAAKKCLAYGQRVQNSVFECVVDSVQFLHLQRELSDIIDENEDSLRFYNLGNSYKNKVIHIGAKPTTPVDETLII